MVVDVALAIDVPQVRPLAFDEGNRRIDDARLVELTPPGIKVLLCAMRAASGPLAVAFHLYAHCSVCVYTAGCR